MQINNTNYNDVMGIAEKFNLDIWATNALEKWMDIMIPPNEDIAKIIKQHSHVVHIEDVEEHIQSVESQNYQNRTQKRQVFFDYFPTYDELSEWLYVQIDLHPQTSELFVIGQTSQGNPIRGIKIYNNNGPSPKKSVFIQGGIHARGWITVTTALYAVQELLNDASVVNDFDFYIVPVLNVDGYIYSRTQRLWRKNRQTNSGSSCIGIDLNRNYNYGWGRGGASTDPCSDIYMGTAPNSALEVASVSRFISSLNEVVFFLDIHCYGAMWMSPWGYTYDYPPDYSLMYPVMEVARSAVRAVNGNVYAIGTSANVIYIAAGGSDDSAYGDYNVIPSFTVEILGNTFVTPPTQILLLAQEIWNGIDSVAEFLAAQK